MELRPSSIRARRINSAPYPSRKGTPPRQNSTMEAKKCYFADCVYLGPAGLTFDQQLQDLKVHSEFIHSPVSNVMADNHDNRALTAKPKELPRPTVSEDSTEGEWKHFLVKWNRYKRSCLSNASDTHVMDQLWATCSESLEKSIFRKGGADTITMEDALLKTIKEMAVRKQNVLVNVVDFLGLGQEPDETVKHYVSRLKGQAQVCDFTIPQGTTDYSDKMVMHQLIRGLSDPTIQEQVLAHSATTKDLNLETIQNFVEGK